MTDVRPAEPVQEMAALPSRVQQPALALGEHTEELPHSLGDTADRAAELKRTKVIEKAI